MGRGAAPVSKGAGGLGIDGYDGVEVCACVLECGGGGLPVGGKFEVGGALEGLGEWGGGAHSGDAVGAEAVGGAGHEIPSSAFRDQAEGIDGAWTGLSIGAGVVEGEFAVAGYGVLDNGEHGEVFGGGVPAGGVDVKALADGGSLFAQADGKGCHELAEGPFGGGAHAGVGEGARLSHEKGAELGFVEAGDVGAPVALELPAALGPAERGDGDVGGAKGLHIAMDGAL